MIERARRRPAGTTSAAGGGTSVAGSLPRPLVLLLAAVGAAVGAAAGAAVLPAPAVAQDVPARAGVLAARVAQAPPGATVRFAFDSKPGVCGDGAERISLRRAGETVMTTGPSRRQEGPGGRDAPRARARPGGWDDGSCVEGPVEVRVERAGADGGIDGARVRVPAGGDGATRGGVVDLGRVPADQAVAFLLADGTLRGASSRAAERLVFAATLARAESWPALLRAGRERTLPERARRSAIFWLAQEAGEKAAEGLVSLIGDDSDELEIRKHAVFALSQIEEEQAIDALIDVARTSREPEVRRQAIFWLGQIRSPRVLAFFEEILRG